MVSIQPLSHGCVFGCQISSLSVIPKDKCNIATLKLTEEALNVHCLRYSGKNSISDTAAAKAVCCCTSVSVRGTGILPHQVRNPFFLRTINADMTVTVV